jgi:hypothetical protein
MSSLLLHVLQQIAQARPHLLSTRQNLVRRQHKAIVASIPELDSHAKCRLCNFKRVVDAVTTDLVNSVADGSASEDRAMYSLDSSDGAISQRLALCGIRDRARTSVTVGVHPKLRVRVDVHVELDTFTGSNAVELRLQCLGLNAVARRRTLVVFCTRRSAGAAALVPVVGPIPVHISSNAAGRWSRLTVLAPHAVGSLGVGKAVRVDNGENVKVVLVLEASDGGVGGSKKLICSILDDPAITVSNELSLG